MESVQKLRGYTATSSCFSRNRFGSIAYASGFRLGSWRLPLLIYGYAWAAARSHSSQMTFADTASVLFLHRSAARMR